jgi:dihydromonapterin reductase/dihydrofolate reductase
VQTKYEAMVIVTGAGRRLGAAMTRTLLEKGYAVLGTYRQQTPEVLELQALGAVMWQADLSTDAGTKAFVSAVQAQVKSIRAIIHNASVWHHDETLMSTLTLREATFALHVFSPYAINQALAPLLMACSGNKDIVFISDASAHKGKSGHALYLASKAAMESIMHTQAQTFAPHIKVNAIAPGLLAFHETDTASYKAMRLSQSLLGIEPGFGAAVDALLFLLNNTYTTSSVLTLDGGGCLPIRPC